MKSWSCHPCCEISKWYVREPNKLEVTTSTLPDSLAKKMFEELTSKQEAQQAAEDRDETLPWEWEEGGGDSRGWEGGWPREKDKVRRDNRVNWREYPWS